MKKVEHLGIAVKDLEAANQTFKKLLGRAHYKVEEVEREGVSTSFFTLGDSKIELLEASNKSSAIAKFIEKKGGGVHHLAIAVDDIHAEMARLKEEGFTLLSDEPMDGADNKLICFLHPKSTLGVLIELCQDRKVL
ncbi:MAG: methylmalonyl-CoA epimerase, partial [Vicingaceae bacterium]